MFGAYLKLVQDLPCREALNSFVCLQLSDLIRDLMDLETSIKLADGSGCRNGYQAEQTIRLASGMLKIRRPRLRGQSGAAATYLKVFRSRKGFQEIPFLFLQGLVRRDLSALGAFLGSSETLWRGAEQRLWARLEEWSSSSLDSRGHQCLVLEKLGFGADLPQLLVALAIDQMGQAQVLDAQPGDADSEQSWSELCLGLKRRGLPDPLLVRGPAVQSHWPQATVL